MLRSGWPVGACLASLLPLLAGCGGTGVEPTSDLSVQHETATERLPCGGSPTCTPVATLPAGHGSPEFSFWYDPHRLDAVVRWGEMISGVVECVEGGEGLGACVAIADIPDMCLAEFSRLADLGGDRAAFEAVFLVPGSPCRPESVEP